MRYDQTMSRSKMRSLDMEMIPTTCFHCQKRQNDKEGCYVEIKLIVKSFWLEIIIALWGYSIVKYWNLLHFEKKRSYLYLLLSGWWSFPSLSSSEFWVLTSDYRDEWNSAESTSLQKNPNSSSKQPGGKAGSYGIIFLGLCLKVVLLFYKLFYKLGLHFKVVEMFY